ncbi:MAG: tail fiber domain-containing protein [bacterium]
MIVCGNIQMCSQGSIPPQICGNLYSVTTYLLCSQLTRVTNTGLSLCVPNGCGCAVDWIATSDVRVKENIEPISSALSTVNSLCGVYYNLCNCNESRSVGLIAQDVQPILPEVVSTSAPSEEDIKMGITDVKYGIKYNKITAVLIEAIKEQQQQIKLLNDEVEKLKTCIDNV